MKRLVVVQFGGDYRPVVFEGLETYFGQIQFIATLESFVAKDVEVTLVTGLSPEPYDVRSPNGLRLIALGRDPHADPRALCQLVREIDPTHLVVHFPLTPLIRDAAGRYPHVMVVLADSFLSRKLRDRWFTRKLVHALRHERIRWVGNHNLPASMHLAQLGVPRRKIIPWDWRRPTPDFEPRVFGPRQQLNVLFVGQLSVHKGATDLVRAVDLASARGLDVHLTLAGGGDEGVRDLVVSSGLERRVTVLGPVVHQQIAELMRSADAVVVPSWHSYSEALPLVIYEALEACTPLIVSDHPMFVSALGDDGALVVPAQEPERLTDAFGLLLDHELATRLSATSPDAWSRIQIDTSWDQVIRAWFVDGEDSPILVGAALSTRQGSTAPSR